MEYEIVSLMAKSDDCNKLISKIGKLSKPPSTKSPESDDNTNTNFKYKIKFDDLPADIFEKIACSMDSRFVCFSFHHFLTKCHLMTIF